MQATLARVDERPLIQIESCEDSLLLSNSRGVITRVVSMASSSSEESGMVIISVGLSDRFVISHGRGVLCVLTKKGGSERW